MSGAVQDGFGGGGTDVLVTSPIADARGGLRGDARGGARGDAGDAGTTERLRDRMNTAAFAFAGIGGVLIAVATIMIWGARLSLRKNSYVSGLGATGEVTATVFNAALLMVAVGGLSVAIAMRRAAVVARRAAPVPVGGRRAAALLTPWVLIAASSLCFFVASQVTCTYECPIPSSPEFTIQDASHISVAVLGFALACLAMGVAALRSRDRAVRIGSWAAGITVAVVAGVGGLLSLAEIGVQVGSWLEFVAMTVALAWLVGYGFAEAMRTRPLL